jgi:hypothetical protein
MAYKQFSAAGADAAQVGFRHLRGFFAGKDNLKEGTALQRGTSSAMRRLAGFKSADIQFPDSTKVTVTGDNSAISIFQFQNAEKPSFTMQFGVGDLQFIGDAQNIPVLTEAGVNGMPVLVPNLILKNLMLLLTRDALDEESGGGNAAGFEHLLLPNIQARYTGTSYNFQAEAVHNFSCIVNDTSFLPDGRTLSSTFGIRRCGAIMYTSQYRLTYAAFLGDGTVKAIASPYKPVDIDLCLATLETTSFATDTLTAIDNTNPSYSVTLTGTPAQDKFAIARISFENYE